MYEFFPLIAVGAIVGVLSVILVVAYALIKDKKGAIGFDRDMKDSEILRRLLAYAKPYWKQFALVLLLMLFAIAYDVLSPILILDDSVSAVDVTTEKSILENLPKERTGTPIPLAHRVTTVEKMDKIVYVEDGKILAVGSHAELLSTCPEYRRMVELQRLDDMENGEGGQN